MEKTKLRHLLQTQKDQLYSRAGLIIEDLRHRDPSHRLDDQSVESANDDVLAALEDEAQQELRDTERALKRLEMNDFGRCHECTAAINDARLALLPHTQYCSACAQMLERESSAERMFASRRG